MNFSRRSFMKWASSLPVLAAATSEGADALSLVGDGTLRAPSPALAAPGYKANLLPSQKETWEHLTWMAQLGPKYTGNKAHVTYVDFLADQMKKSGLDVTRDNFKFPRWEAKRWEIAIQPGSGASFRPKVTSYFPYSGQTPAQGVTAELVYAGFYKPQPPAPGATPASAGAAEAAAFDLSNVRGKVVLVDFAVGERHFGAEYEPWGIYPSSTQFPAVVRPARAAINDLTKFQKAGAVAVILAWTDVSDANAQDQYTPFSRPPQGIPGLYVGRDTGAKLKEMAKSGAKATVVLEADIFPDTPTDTVIAMLPGSSDETIMVNTHTDGPNATEENGAVACVALAKYFAAIPKSDRKRTIVFPMTTGHFAGPWVPSIRGVIEKYPDMVKRCVAAVTVEHLACREWLDDASLHYRATGENEWTMAITEYKSMGNPLVDALQGSVSNKTAVVNPAHGGWIGEGSAPNRAGIPTIGYMPQPNYLLAGPENCDIEKLSAELLHSQIEVFAKLIHKIDQTSAADLKVKT
jgi:hypothetical protein